MAQDPDTCPECGNALEIELVARPGRLGYAYACADHGMLGVYDSV
jgi:predicted RNA-binding Zn-ribbon protein involved in translation (DUF1610 family)